jgi:hypothetical protein
MPGRPPKVAWRCSRNELSGKAGAVQFEVMEFGGEPLGVKLRGQRCDLILVLIERPQALPWVPRYILTRRSWSGVTEGPPGTPRWPSGCLGSQR